LKINLVADKANGKSLATLAQPTENIAKPKSLGLMLCFCHEIETASPWD